MMIAAVPTMGRHQFFQLIEPVVREFKHFVKFEGIRLLSPRTSHANHGTRNA
jgi:hypothetical protein